MATLGINDLKQLALPSYIDAAYLERLAFSSIKQSLKNLRGCPAVAAQELAGALSLHGAYFRIADAQLFALDPISGEFTPVAQAAHRAALADPRF